MTDEEKNTIRAQVTANAQHLVDGLAPLYLGRTCPLKRGATELERECDGVKCMLYAPLNDDAQNPQKVTGAACGISVAVARVTELVSVQETLAHALKNLAAASSAPHILKT